MRGMVGRVTDSILSPADRLPFMLAGNATVTARNPDRDTHVTYKIRQPREGSPHFVSVLTGGEQYRYVGTIFDRRDFRLSAKSPRPDAPSVRAFRWLWDRLIAGASIAPAELWHSGRCGRCGRELTDPASIARGIGPVCANLV